ncbi:hypothetical protein BX600DRAFT_1308 [Xylariales sp. PMI_506]|nr:hypothetical protein BX600DRAFT_1308 [Xylariales sp. PMI_506]
MYSLNWRPFPDTGHLFCTLYSSPLLYRIVYASCCQKICSSPAVTPFPLQRRILFEITSRPTSCPHCYPYISYTSRLPSSVGLRACLGWTIAMQRCR